MSEQLNGYTMTDRQLMLFRFNRKNMKKHTGMLADILGMKRKDFEAAVKRGMDEEARERRGDPAKYYKVFLKEPTCVCGPFSEMEMLEMMKEKDADLYGFLTAQEYEKSYGDKVEAYL